MSIRSLRQTLPFEATTSARLRSTSTTARLTGTTESGSYDAFSTKAFMAGRLPAAPANPVDVDNTQVIDNAFCGSLTTMSNGATLEEREKRKGR